MSYGPAVSFGKNPFVAKAQAAEQKAADATDGIARVSAYRDAAHQWDRAAQKEKPGKFRTEYEEAAERNRALAEGDDAPTERLPASNVKPPTQMN